MGRDKALLEVDGVPMAQRVARALLAAGAGDVCAVGGDEPSLRALGLRVLADERPGGGPLPATRVALRHALHDRVVVAACDLVHPSPLALGATLDALDATPTAHVAVPVSGGVRQWAHAAWRREAGALLDAAVATGARSLRRAAASLEVVELHGLDDRALADADEPSDLPGSLRPMEVPEVDVHELAKRREAGAPLIDVREDHEWSAGRVPGAHHIPLGEVVERVEEVPTDVTVFVICAGGGRSKRAVLHYRSIGIDAVNVAGGTRAWIEAGHPIDGRGSGAGA